jgi:hypothetical protein
VLVGYGVVRLGVRDIRRELKIIVQHRGVSVLFDALPDPIRWCFAHSEIGDETVLPGGVRIAAQNLGEEERAAVRAALAYRCEILIAPRS